MKGVVMERATELEFLQWWYGECDFGPADSDVNDIMKENFIEEKKKNIPEGYNLFSDGESSTDRE
jgi:hypothetical protein